MYCGFFSHKGENSGENFSHSEWSHKSGKNSLMNPSAHIKLLLLFFFSLLESVSRHFERFFFFDKRKGKSFWTLIEVTRPKSLALPNAYWKEKGSHRIHNNITNDSLQRNLRCSLVICEWKWIKGKLKTSNGIIIPYNGV